MRFHIGPPDPGAISTERWDEGWSVELAWADIDGRMECVGVAVVGDGTEPLTASLLRHLPIGAMILERRRIEAALDHTQPILDSTGEPIDRSFDAPRPCYDDEHYQAVADAYDEAMRAGIPPTAHVQDKLRLRTRTQAGKQVARARERGLLPPTEQRVPKGNT